MKPLGPALALLLAGCSPAVDGGQPDAGADAAPDLGVPFGFPRAATLGGAVIAQPSLAVITFAGDPLETSITQFNDALKTSSYFATIGQEYGVGAIVAVAHIGLAESAPAAIDDTGIKTWLASKLGAAPFGAADSNTLYAIYYPAQTAITHGTKTSGGSAGCQAFKGFHGEVAVGGTSVGYAILPRCAVSDPSLTALETLTIPASHEYFEWATDPFPQSDPAWHRVVPDSAAWGLAFANELADLCDGRTTHTRPADLGFTVQSVWSNQSSTMGHAPCQPAVAPRFAAAIPTLPDAITLAPALLQSTCDPASGAVPGVIVAPGARVTLAVHLYADGPTTTPWHLDAVEGGQALATANLTLSLDRADVMAGDDVTLTVSAPASFQAPSTVVLYVSGIDAGPAYTRWPILVSPSASP